MGLMSFQPLPEPADRLLARPHRDRFKILARSWADQGLGSPPVVAWVYVFKVLLLWGLAGFSISVLSSGLPWQPQHWVTEPIVWQKVVAWTVLMEVLGLAGAWGPLCGHFKPVTGGFLFWLKPGTIRQPPVPSIPGTRGYRRSVLDVVLYVALIGSLVALMVLPGTNRADLGAVLPGVTGGLLPTLPVWLTIGLLIVAGLRDKTIFLAARGEQYLPVLFAFAAMGFPDMLIAAKITIVVVWVGAGVSKLTPHFSFVIPPMLSNTPWLKIKAIKRAHYRSFPEDLRPSRAATGLAHVGGTLLECAVPLIMLFSTNWWITWGAVAIMVIFHLFILSTFPLAVPLEWNAHYAWLAFFLFGLHQAGQGFAVWDGSPWLIAFAAVLLVPPILGNIRPDKVSFLPSLRQYSGNWATSMWAFAPGAEDRLDRGVTKPARMQRFQLEEMYDAETAEVVLDKTVTWRTLHSQGRIQLSLMMRELGDRFENYTLREGEFIAGGVIGWNFGDGHLHDERLVEAVQEQCNFLPGELIVTYVESQPMAGKSQRYRVIDASLGIIETGTVQVADAVTELPWLPNGPIPVQPDERETTSWTPGAVPAPVGLDGRQTALRRTS